MHPLKEAKVRFKRVLVRTDFNVPIKNGKILNDSRIKEALPTIKYLMKNKARVILISHLGRPQGTDDKLRMKPIGEKLSRLLKKKIVMAEDCIGNSVKETISKMRPGEIMLLENVRFYAEEEQNNADFAQYLAELGDIYANDAFSVSHRAHASVEAVTHLLPSYAGLALEKEVKELSALLLTGSHRPKKPYVVILGGAKVKEKLPLLMKFVKQADAILIGGAMMFTFLKAQGKEIGKSLFEPEQIENAKKLMKTKKIIIPIDVATNKGTVACDKIKKGMKGLDIGKETIEIFSYIIKQAKTIFWNGPLGYIEDKKYAKGSKEIAKAISKNKGITIAGGGDTISIVQGLKFTHISTGGGATLEFLSGQRLPGIIALDQNNPVRQKKP